MTQVNIHEAKTTLSKLLEAVESGEEVIIARAGKLVAKIVKFSPPKKRKLGLWKGKVHVEPEFDQADKEIERMFEESSIWPTSSTPTS